MSNIKLIITIMTLFLVLSLGVNVYYVVVNDKISKVLDDCIDLTGESLDLAEECINELEDCNNYLEILLYDVEGEDSE